jgi:hypothetical protein
VVAVHQLGSGLEVLDFAVADQAPLDQPRVDLRGATQVTCNCPSR